MNKHESSTATGGISFTGLLGIVFIVLKLTDVINWPWIWVLCPLWIGIVLWIVIILAILGYTIARDHKYRKRMEHRRKEKE